MTKGRRHRLEVWGELACFTRPEAKAERLSYPVMTPSAARGILDAIYWTSQDELFWQLLSIELLKTPQYISLRRHEVKEKMPHDSCTVAWVEGKERPEPIWADLYLDRTTGRTTRQTMALKNVHYRLTARLCSRTDQPLQRHDEQFARRVRLGQCRYQPYLGCREFPAYFEAADKQLSPVPLDLDLGVMLYDVFDLSRSGKNAASVSLFHGVLKQGVLVVPEFSDARVLKG